MPSTAAQSAALGKTTLFLLANVVYLRILLTAQLTMLAKHVSSPNFPSVAVRYREGNATGTSLPATC